MKSNDIQFNLMITVNSIKCLNYTIDKIKEKFNNKIENIDSKIIEQIFNNENLQEINEKIKDYMYLFSNLEDSII